MYKNYVALPKTEMQLIREGCTANFCLLSLQQQSAEMFFGTDLQKLSLSEMVTLLVCFVFEPTAATLGLRKC